MASYCQKRKKKKMSPEVQVEKIDFESGFSDLLKVMNGIPHAAKEIFLRELVLNAAKALVRLRLDTLYEEDIEYGPRGLHIDIIPDKSNNTLSIVDNGTGMNKAHLKQLFSVKGKGDRMDSAMEIRRKQVGVDSFYMPGGGGVFLSFPAVFMVADSVEVTTHHYQSVKPPCKLFCDSDHRYFVVKDAVSTTQRGTKVTLKLNKDHSEYLDLARLKNLIDKYPMELCHFPITICSPAAGEIIGQRRADVKEMRKDINVLMNKFKSLEQLFKRTLVGRNLYLKDVVLSERYPDIPAVLSLDRETLYISPRGKMMANLRREAEFNPDDEDVLARIDLLQMAAVNNIQVYDDKHGTDYMRETVR